MPKYKVYLQEHHLYTEPIFIYAESKEDAERIADENGIMPFCKANNGNDNCRGCEIESQYLVYEIIEIND